MKMRVVERKVARACCVREGEEARGARNWSAAGKLSALELARRENEGAARANAISCPKSDPVCLPNQPDWLASILRRSIVRSVSGQNSRPLGAIHLCRATRYLRCSPRERRIEFLSFHLSGAFRISLSSSFARTPLSHVSKRLF